MSFTQVDLMETSLVSEIRRMQWQIRMLQERMYPIDGGEREGSDSYTYIYRGNIPLGGIILWSGAITEIPTSWQLCDGTNDTPNLQDRFVVGAGSTYNPDDTGGADTNDLSHTHGPGTLSTDNDSHTHGPGTLNTDNDTHNHDVTGASASAGAHEHGVGTYATGASDSNYELLYTIGATSKLLADYDHRHGLSGHTENLGAHNHTDGTYATDNDTHDHDVNSGVTANDTHDHNVDAGATASAGSVAQENKPLYYALAFIMRIA